MDLESLDGFWNGIAVHFSNDTVGLYVLVQALVTTASDGSVKGTFETTNSATGETRRGTFTGTREGNVLSVEADYVPPFKLNLVLAGSQIVGQGLLKALSGTAVLTMFRGRVAAAKMEVMMGAWSG